MHEDELASNTKWAMRHPGSLKQMRCRCLRHRQQTWPHSCQVELSHIVAMQVGWRSKLQTTTRIPIRGGKRIIPIVTHRKKAPVEPLPISILQTTRNENVGSSGFVSSWYPQGHPDDHDRTRWENWEQVATRCGKFGVRQQGATSKTRESERMNCAVGYMDMTNENRTSKKNAKRGCTVSKL